MLTEILKAFRETEGPLDLNELSRWLDTEPGALEGMLQTLVRQGKLRETCPGSAGCLNCSSRLGCGGTPAGDMMGKVYELPGNPAEGGV